MVITAQDVNKLRTATGAGMMDCKKALEETNGDFEAAIDVLRKKGQKVASKRADREANEGVVLSRTSIDGKSGIIIKLTSETDFVAKNADFIKFAESIADVAINEQPTDLANLKTKTINGVDIQSLLDETVAKIGEKIDVIEYVLFAGEGVVSYTHAGNRIGVLVETNLPLTDAIIAGAKDACMQVAAMNPIALDNADVDATVIERELEIAKEQIRNEGKPENMVEKIAQGKLNKFYKESTLLNQDFVKDPSRSVRKMLQDIDSDLTITKFKRVALGE